MSAVSVLKNFHLTHLSTPAADRTIYKAAIQKRPKSIVEIGVGTAVRTQRLLQRLLQDDPADSIRYTGIDLFEARSASATGMPLKKAHALLKPLGVRLQLVPGDPCTALGRVANNLRDTELLIISADQDADSLARAWFFVPRMLNATSEIYWEVPAAKGTTAFRLVPHVEIQKLAESQPRVPRRAA